MNRSHIRAQPSAGHRIPSIPYLGQPKPSVGREGVTSKRAKSLTRNLSGGSIGITNQARTASGGRSASPAVGRRSRGSFGREAKVAGKREGKEESFLELVKKRVGQVQNESDLTDLWQAWMLTTGVRPQAALKKVVQDPGLLLGLQKLNERYAPETAFHPEIISWVNAGQDIVLTGPGYTNKLLASVVASFLTLLERHPDHDILSKICFIAPDFEVIAVVNDILGVISANIPQLPRDEEDNILCIITDTVEGFLEALSVSDTVRISPEIIGLVLIDPGHMKEDMARIIESCVTIPQLTIITIDEHDDDSENVPGDWKETLRFDMSRTDTGLGPAPLPSFTRPNPRAMDIESPTAVPRFNKNTIRSASTESFSAEEEIDVTIRTVDMLHLVQTDFDAIKMGYLQAWEQLKSEWLEKMRPNLNGRAELLNADHGVLSAGSSSELQEHRSRASRKVSKTKDFPIATPSVPGFWFRAMTSHPLLEEVIELHDKDVLMYLENIDFEWNLTYDPNNANRKSFVIVFYFKENPYFTNRILTKTFIVQKHYISPNFWSDMGEDVLSAAIGCEIYWGKDQCLTTKTVYRKQRNRKTNQTRQIKESVPQNSFFNFFQTHAVSSPEAKNVDDLDHTIEAEFEVGLVIRDKIIPNAIGWYMGYEKDSEFEESSYDSEYDSF